MTNNRDFLFIYNGTFCQPNGDPSTKEQRMDITTGELLVSDVRIKRYIRDFLSRHTAHTQYMLFDEETKAFASKYGKKASGSEARMSLLEKKLPGKDVFKECIDVRLFGGISTAKKNTQQATGAVQIRLLNESMHQVKNFDYQNSTTLPSDVANAAGSFGSLNIVPYFVALITGQVNGCTADLNKMTPDDLAAMYGAMWLSLDDQSSRSKQGQHPLLLVDIEYNRPTRLNNTRSLVKLNHEGRGVDLREATVQSYDVEKLLKLQNSSIVKQVNYYTEDDDMLALFQAAGSKFSLMTLTNNYELR